MANVEKVSVALTANLLAEVRQAVSSGEYASSSEVLREALRDWTAKRSRQMQQLEALKADIDKGLADLASGHVKNFDTDAIVARGRSLLAERTTSG